jgi:hypothetical protein
VTPTVSMLSPERWLHSLTLDIPDFLHLRRWLSSLAMVGFGCGMAPMWLEPTCINNGPNTTTSKSHIRHEDSSPVHRVGNALVDVATSRTDLRPLRRRDETYERENKCRRYTNSPSPRSALEWLAARLKAYATPRPPSVTARLRRRPTTPIPPHEISGDSERAYADGTAPTPVIKSCVVRELGVR